MLPRRYKSPLAALLAWGPWSSRRLGPPKSGVIDTPATEPRAGILAVRDLENAHPQPAPPVPSAYPEIAPELLSELHRTLCPEIKALRVAQLKRARYFQPTFAVIDARDRVLHEFSHGWEDDVRSNNYIFEQVRLRRPLRLHGRTLLLDVRTHSQNYFHWLIEALPRVEFARLAGWRTEEFEHVLVSGATRPFHLETLRLAGLDSAKIVNAAQHAHVECDELIATSDTRMFTYDATAVALRKLFAQPLAEAERAPRLRLFVSRADASARRLLNEDDVFAQLAPLGFTRVTLGTRSVTEQATLFAQAEVIVSPHGAALANLVFCRPSTRVIELHYPRYTLGLYWQMAERLGLRYGAVRGLVAGDGDPRQADMTVAATEIAMYAKRILG